MITDGSTMLSTMLWGIAAAGIPAWLFVYEAGLRMEREMRLERLQRRAIERLRRQIGKLKVAAKLREAEEVAEAKEAKGATESP